MRIYEVYYSRNTSIIHRESKNKTDSLDHIFATYCLIFTIFFYWYTQQEICKIQPHVTSVATLPCKILIAENYHAVGSHIAVHDGALSCWSMNSPEAWGLAEANANHSSRFHRLRWLPDRRISNRCCRRHAVYYHQWPNWRSFLCEKAFCPDVFILCCSRCAQSVTL